MPQGRFFDVWHTHTHYFSAWLGALSGIRQLIRLSLPLVGILPVIGTLVLVTMIPAPAGSGLIVMASALLPAPSA